MKIDRPLALAAFFGWLTEILGNLAQLNGAMIPWSAVVYVSLAAAMVACVVGVLIGEAPDGSESG